MAVAVAVAVGHGTWLLYIPARPKVVYTHQHSTGVAYIQIQLLQSTVPSIPANSTTSTGGILSGPQYYILQSYVSIYDIPYVTFRLGTFFFFFHPIFWFWFYFYYSQLSSSPISSTPRQWIKVYTPSPLLTSTKLRYIPHFPTCTCTSSSSPLQHQRLYIHIYTLHHRGEHAVFGLDIYAM